MAGYFLLLILLKFKLTSFYFSLACDDLPQYRLSPLEPAVKIRDSLTMYCTLDRDSADSGFSSSDIYFQIDTTNAELTADLKRVEVFNESTIALKITANELWNNILLDCCYKEKCCDQQKITVFDQLPIPTITGYKVFDWKSLEITWAFTETKILQAEYFACYKLHSQPNFLNENTSCLMKTDPQTNCAICSTTLNNSFGYCNSQSNYLECSSQNGENKCRVEDLFQVESVIVIVEMKIIGRSEFDNVESDTIYCHLENIVQMKPVEILHIETFNNNGSSPSIGYTNIRFNVSSIPRIITALLFCTCDEDDFKIERSFEASSITEIAYQLTGLPLAAQCKCSVKIRSLGLWSNESFVEFQSPLDVPMKNPLLAGYTVDCKPGIACVVNLYFEAMLRKESRGEIEFIKASISLDDGCFILPNNGNILEKCMKREDPLKLSSLNVVDVCSNSSSTLTFLMSSDSSCHLNISYVSENKAGQTNKSDWSLINEEKGVSLNSIHNLSAVRQNDSTVRLFWNATPPSKSPSLSFQPYFIVVWCLIEQQECKDVKQIRRNLDTMSFDIDMKSSNVMRFGVGLKIQENVTPKLNWTSSLCYINASPLPPKLELAKLAGKTADISYHMTHCNQSGLAYKQVFLFRKFDETNNITELIMERTMEFSGEDGVVQFEIPDEKYDYKVQSMSMTWEGLSKESNVILLKVEPSSNASVLWPIWMILCVVVPVVSIIFLISWIRKHQTRKLKFEIPQSNNYVPAEYGDVGLMRNSSHSITSSLDTNDLTEFDSHHENSERTEHLQKVTFEVMKYRPDLELPQSEKSEDNSYSTSHNSDSHKLCMPPAKSLSIPNSNQNDCDYNQSNCNSDPRSSGCETDDLYSPGKKFSEPYFINTLANPANIICRNDDDTIHDDDDGDDVDDSSSLSVKNETGGEPDLPNYSRVFFSDRVDV